MYLSADQDQPSTRARLRRRWLALLLLLRAWTPGMLRRLSPEQRIYAGALAVGLLLNALALFSALQAQGRFPQIPFQLPSLDDISLPGRPVLRPVLDPGELRTDVSEAVTVGHVSAHLGDDVSADVDIPPPGLAKPAKLVLRANLPRLFASDPPIGGFKALRLVDVYLADARTGARVDAPPSGLGLDLKVAIRPMDLERAGGDPSKLLLLKLDLAHDTWADTHARIENGYLVVHTDSLAPFAIGLVAPDEKPTDLVPSLLNLLGPPTPTPSPTTQAPLSALGEPTPTPTPNVIVDPLPGLPLPDTIVSLAPVLPSRTLSPTPVPEPPDRETEATPESNHDRDEGRPSPPATPAPRPGLSPTAEATPPSGTTSTPAPSVAVSQGTPTPTSTPVVTTTPGVTATTIRTPVVTTPPAPALTVSPTPRARPNARVIDIAAPPPTGDVGRIFELADGTVLRPGDQVVTNIIVYNSGNLGLTYTMAVDATQTSQLDLDPASGLQLSVIRCGFTFTVCNQPVYAGPAISANVVMGGPETVGGRQQTGLRPLTMDYLQMRVGFPTNAGNAFASATSVLRFTWTSAQAF